MGRTLPGGGVLVVPDLEVLLGAGGFAAPVCGKEKACIDINVIARVKTVIFKYFFFIAKAKIVKSLTFKEIYYIK
jgi:hypothetical protein